MLLLLLGCAMVMLRPAHSLAKFEGGGTLGVDPDPAAFAALAECLDAPDCELPERTPVDLEYRLGLGRGWEIGARGVLPPRALSLKYAVLDERRHPTPVSVALRAEAGVVPRTHEGRLDLLPFARGEVLVSGTLSLSPGVALRPVGSVGFAGEPTSGGELQPGCGYTAGLLVPLRLPGHLAFAPALGVAGFIPLDGVGTIGLRVGITVEPWLGDQSPGG